MKSKVVKVKITRQESNFDRACETAYKYALMEFGIDEAGHAKDKRFERSRSELVVEFRKYRHSGGMGGHTYTYEFDVWMEQSEDDDD